MKNGVVVAVIGVSAVVLCTLVVSTLVVIGYLDPSPYTEQVQCTISGEADQAAIGQVYTLILDGRESVKVQKSQCFNFESKKVGDEFTAIIVYDDSDVLRSITRVRD